MERQLIIFNKAHDDSLGEIIKKLLQAKAKLARLKIKTRETDEEYARAKAEADEADNTYEQYSQLHEKLQNEETIPELDDQEEKDIKRIYRLACSLCHPDKVSKDYKEEAHDNFVELQKAYKSNDLSSVEAIYKELLAKGRLKTRSSSLTEVETLQAVITEMEYSIRILTNELKTIANSNEFNLIAMAGNNMSEWNNYFEKRRESLEDLFYNIEQEIAELKQKT